MYTKYYRSAFINLTLVLNSTLALTFRLQYKRQVNASVEFELNSLVSKCNKLPLWFHRVVLKHPVNIVRIIALVVTASDRLLVNVETPSALTLFY